jgi:hypothetical protein
MGSQRLVTFAGGSIVLNLVSERGCPDMKKLKNEKELVKKAIAAGVKYGEERGVVEFEPTDSATEKIEYIYRLLVHDKVIQPLPQDQVSQLSMKHRLAMWASKLD